MVQCNVLFSQLEEWLKENSSLPMPPMSGEDTIFEYVVGEKGQWEHWSDRVRTTQDYEGFLGIPF